MKRLVVRGLILFILVALTINPLSGCIAQTDGQKAVEFGYTKEDYVETFSGFKSSSDAECVTYADAILNGTLYVSETFDGAPIESMANIDWNMNFTESPNTFLPAGPYPSGDTGAGMGSDWRHPVFRGWKNTDRKLEFV